MCQDVCVTESAQIVRPFRGISAAERLRQRKAALLDAGLSAVAQDGLAGTTTDAVTARAGLSKRYFYEHFHTRDDLFVALAESLIEQITTAVMQAVADRHADLSQRLRAAFTAVVEILTDDPRNARLYVEVIGSGPLKDTIGRAERTLAGLLVEALLADTDATAHDRARLGTASLVIVVGIAQAVSDWLDGAIELSRSELIDEIATMSTAATRAVRPDL